MVERQGANKTKGGKGSEKERERKENNTREKKGKTFTHTQGIKQKTRRAPS